MNDKFLSLSLIFFMVLFTTFTCLQAQQTISASGGESTGSTGTVSFTVGQLFYQTHVTEAGSLAEGVQHPWEISVITSVEGFPAINLSVSAFPNPAREVLNLLLDVESENVKGYRYLLYDANGRLVKQGDIASAKTRIAFSDLDPAPYFLKVFSDSREVKTFKIIKN